MSDKTYKLMIKTHAVTGLKYLCMTKKDNWVEYTGSGVHWLNHISKHGKNIDTELIYETPDYEKFICVCEEISENLDVVNSTNFANAIPEHGYENGRSGKNNFELWYETLGENEKKVFHENRGKRIKNNHWSKSSNRKNVCEKISQKQNNFWQSKSQDFRSRYTQNIRELAHEFFLKKDNPEYKKFVERQRKNSRKSWSNMSTTERQEHKKKTSYGRLNMDEKSKEERAEKIRKVYATGKHDGLFERYSQERLGENNPNAKIIVWEGERYTVGKFHEFLKENSISRSYAYKILDSSDAENCYKEYNDIPKTYETLTCPHCGADSGGKLPTAFKRWHMNNCKMRKRNG